MSGRFEYFGKYLLLEKLATGGMAEVFLARAQAHGGITKFVAIKRILPQYADSREFIDMFKDEAKIAVNLNHSNIVSIYDFGVQNNQFYLVMDYVEGRNLRQIINKIQKTQQRLSFDQIIYIVKEVASGLDHAHRCLDGSTGKPLNITHRDMSPQNVMVSFEGEIKIVDFGIAKAESQLETTRAGTLKGKFGYMSPEQAEGQTVDLRTDIFSLGIVLWELLANDRLFIANNEVNTLRKIRDCQIPSLRKLNPNIPGELERIAQKALARDRNLRYQTAAAMHRDLNRFLNRQYPEFSPQDFASFVKNVFSEEIFSTRRRLVEYAKMPVAEIGETSAPPQASPAADNTSSYVDSSSPSQISGPKLADGTPLRFSEQLTQASTPPDSQPSANPLPATQGILNEGALQRELAGGRLDRIASRPPEGEISSPPQRRPEKLVRPMPASRSYNGGPAPLIGAAVAFVFCSYLLMAKTLPELMGPVIDVTDTFLKPVHRLIGIEARELGSVEPQVRQVEEPILVPAPPEPEPILPPAPAPAPKPKPVAAVTPELIQKPVPKPPKPEAEPVDDDPVSLLPLNPKEPQSTIVVSSDPSGAEIILNGKSVGDSTPAKIAVPSSRPFTITLRRSGYIDYRSSLLTVKQYPDKFAATLQPSLVGYLDIDVKPPQNVKVYVNNQHLKGEQLPIMRYAVPAETEVTIRAENPITGASQTRRIRVQKDSRTQITLDLKRSKNGRQPTQAR